MPIYNDRARPKWMILVVYDSMRLVEYENAIWYERLVYLSLELVNVGSYD